MEVWNHLQRQLFPILQEEVGTLTEKDKQFVEVMGLVPLGLFLESYRWVGNGRPPHERAWLVHAFMAKAVSQFPTTRALLEALQARPALRRLCGWESASDIPHESTFSRAFAAFAQAQLPQGTHPGPSQTAGAPTRAHPGRESGRLPTACSAGCKRHSQGHQECWIGSKLHLDTLDGDIPVSAILTSASVNDSQVAIPLAQMTAQRITSLYDLMDSADDAPPIHQDSRRLGHVPIIDPNPRRGEKIPLDPAQAQRFKPRSSSERVNSWLKECYGGRLVRGRGAKKVMAHLMFGLIALTAMQLYQLIW